MKCPYCKNIISEKEKTCPNCKINIEDYIKNSQYTEDKFYKKHGKHSDTESFRQFHAEYMCAFPAGDMDAARKWEEQAQQLQNLLTSHNRRSIIYAESTKHFADAKEQRLCEFRDKARTTCTSLLRARFGVSAHR